MIKCAFCSDIFSFKGDLARHVSEVHEGKNLMKETTK